MTLWRRLDMMKRVLSTREGREEEARKDVTWRREEERDGRVLGRTDVKKSEEKVEGFYGDRINLVG